MICPTGRSPVRRTVDIAVGHAEAQVPADRQDDHLRREPKPGERRGESHWHMGTTHDPHVAVWSTTRAPGEASHPPCFGQRCRGRHPRPLPRRPRRGSHSHASALAAAVVPSAPPHPGHD
jgi:hypothetical protein